MQQWDLIEYYTNVCNQSLYRFDPMHTGSFENEDEYVRMAQGIATQLSGCIALRDAIADEFAFWFGVDKDSEKVNIITKRLATSLASE